MKKIKKYWEKNPSLYFPIWWLSFCYSTLWLALAVGTATSGVPIGAFVAWAISLFFWCIYGIAYKAWLRALGVANLKEAYFLGMGYLTEIQELWREIPWKFRFYGILAGLFQLLVFYGFWALLHNLFPLR